MDSILSESVRFYTRYFVLPKKNTQFFEEKILTDARIELATCCDMGMKYAL
jgi:hypothetical protein